MTTYTTRAWAIEVADPEIESPRFVGYDSVVPAMLFPSRQHARDWLRESKSAEWRANYLQAWNARVVPVTVTVETEPRP